MSTPSNSAAQYTPEKIRELVDQTPASGPKRSLGLIALVATSARCSSATTPE